MLTIFLPHFLSISLELILNLPKKLLLLINSLKDKAETSNPLREVRLANSTTGTPLAMTLFVRLILTPSPSQSAKYFSATFGSKMTKSSPNTT